ncbi:LIM domain only protein 7b isoform X2 [Engraulis encrasicolus]|uniref:LIM domain only protein 7b isoform X2 n=1 Tax=Engraulis encrasicolus TaxID=184585 RepID=UPI002FD4408B
MEWRGQKTVSSDLAFSEAQRWVEEVTQKSFGSSNFRLALENGVLLCDLVNKLRPGIINRVNRLSTPIAGLDNVNVFLKACRKLGLNEAQLFHPGDLQDVSTRVTVRREETNRRIKNVLITLYWLGRKAQADPFYSGPLLNLKAFEGLLGTTLTKALEEWSPRWSVRDSGYSESWFPDREELLGLQATASCKSEDSIESLDSTESRTLSATSDTTLRAGSEGCGSDAEAEQGFRMADSRDGRGRGYMPTPLRRKREQHEDTRTSPLIRSKSLSDIPLGPLSSAPPHPPLFRSSLTFDISLEAAAAGQMRQEHMRRVHGTVRETDDKWQEDLNAWKNKRRSTKSSLHRKTEDEDTNPNKSEREAHGNYVTAATCYPAQVAHTPLLQQQPQAHVQPQHQEAFVYTPRLRASLARTDAQDLPRAGSPSRGRPPSSEPAAHGESPSLGSLPSDLASSLNPSSGSQLGTTIATTTTMPGLMGSSGSPGGTGMTSGVGTVGGAGLPLVPTNPSTPPPVSTTTTSGAPKVHWNSPVSSSLTGSPLAGSRPASAVLYTATEAPDSQHDDLQHLQGASSGYRPVTPAGKSYDGGSRVSASLPRGFRRSEGTSCLSAGVTPRPFGKTSRLSMPKLYSKDDSHKSLSGIQKTERPAFSSVAAPYTKVTTPAEAEHPVAPATQSSPKQQESREEETGLTVGRISAPVNQSSPKFTASLPDYTSGPPVVESEVLHSDMRVSLNQRPNSGTDFGFQTNWDSTGVRITSIQPGSPAEQCHLRVGDELLSVNGQRVAQLNYTQWKGTMADALAKGTLLMDVRRHGHSDWDLSGHPSLQYKSHKTLNLTTADSTLVGRPERYINVSQEPSVAAAAPSSASHMTNGLTNNGVEPAAMNGGYHDNTEPMRNKGGSESAISDLQVPSISASSSRWSWDPEEDRKKHESWQAEQERLLQEKYERDQQRLEDEWRRAQQETGGDASNHDGGLRGPEEHRDFERANGTAPLPYSSHSAASRFAAPNQHIEGEILVKAREGPLLNAAAPLPQGAGHDEYEGSNTNQWPDESYGFAALAPADRTKSKSTPTLDFFNKEEEDSPREFNVEKKLGQQMSQVEFERQQILDEMRKRTHLHRDSSWIRQRSSSSSYQKEPILTGPSVRRFESMDDLHSGSGSWTRPSSAASNHMRPHSALGSFGGYRGPTGRYSMGAMGMGTAGSSSTLPTSLSASSVRQGPWTRPASTSPTPTPLREEQGGLPQRMSKPLSGRRMCTRCERPLAKGAAMVIESLGLCYHLVCFKCVSCRSELRRPGPGSQVRVRNKQLYCDSCYGRLRARPAPK